MKLSLSWVFDHIQASWKDVDIPALIKKFTTTVVEVSAYTYINVDLSLFAIVVIRAVKNNAIFGFIPEFGQEVKLPLRDNVQEGQLYMIWRSEKGYTWASGIHFNAGTALLPALSLHDDQIAGGWKNSFENEDIILEFDNVVLTHRPDLWGHRGFAREIAAILDLPLVPLDQLLASLPVKRYEYNASPTPEADFGLHIEDKKACKRIAAMYIPRIEHEGSWLWMAHRLLRVDGKPIDAFVDTTNYVMFDIGQPMHAFDANMLEKRALHVRRAQANQQLLLLDDRNISLQPEALVLTDNHQPVALAGIMGGKQTAVTPQTESLLVEAACFDPVVIRKSVHAYKLRTEASARFEKNVDPANAVYALLRFLHIVNRYATVIAGPQVIVYLGKDIEQRRVILTHEFLEKKLGVSLTFAFVHATLSKLEFHVEVTKTEPITYTIDVPSFRATKDILLPEDIVEEVGRYYGLEKIPHTMPSVALKMHDIGPSINLDRIKHYLAFGAAMHEVQNYALYDEAFLQQLQYNPPATPTVKNPVSEMMYRLVTSLIPNLLKSVASNSATYDVINFFEYNTIFGLQDNQINQQKSLSGVFYHSKDVDFYEKKQVLEALFSLLHIDVSWHKALTQLADWYHPYQTAQLLYNDQCIGFAGLSNPYFLQKLLPGSAFIFELDARLLLYNHKPIVQFEPLSKYQTTWADLSILVPAHYTAQYLMDLIRASDNRIVAVQLIDFYQKKDWHDQRSLTIRYFAQADDRTLTTEEVKDIYDHAVAAVKRIGATLR